MDRCCGYEKTQPRTVGFWYLVPDPRNARIYSEDQVARVAASIAEFGFTNPILCVVDGLIIAGHGRWLAVQRLGLTQVPVVVLDHLTDSQRRALLIADNHLTELAGWDDVRLRGELAALQEMRVSLWLTRCLPYFG